MFLHKQPNLPWSHTLGRQRYVYSGLVLSQRRDFVDPGSFCQQCPFTPASERQCWREIGTNLWKLKESLLIALEAMDETKEQCLHHFCQNFYEVIILLPKFYTGLPLL